MSNKPASSSGAGCMKHAHSSAPHRAGGNWNLQCAPGRHCGALLSTRRCRQDVSSSSDRCVTIKAPPKRRCAGSPSDCLRGGARIAAHHHQMHRHLLRQPGTGIQRARQITIAHRRCGKHDAWSVKAYGPWSHRMWAKSSAHTAQTLSGSYESFTGAVRTSTARVSMPVQLPAQGAMAFRCRCMYTGRVWPLILQKGAGQTKTSEGQPQPYIGGDEQSPGGCAQNTETHMYTHAYQSAPPPPHTCAACGSR